MALKFPIKRSSENVHISEYGFIWNERMLNAEKKSLIGVTYVSIRPSPDLSCLQIRMQNARKSISKTYVNSRDEIATNFV